jgi:phosphatidate cytidylyltransferase
MNRSHKQRLLIAFTLGPIFLAAAWVGDVWFLAIVALIAVFSQYELLKMVHYPPRVLMVLTLVVTPLCLLAMFFTRFDIVFLILLFAAIFTNLSLFFYRSSEFIKMSFVGLGSIIYPGLSLGSMILLRNIQIEGYPEIDMGRNIVIMMIIAVYATDIFAFYIGRLIGKHPLSPSVSPKKTIEGAVGGFVFSCVAMIILWLVDFIPVFQVFDYLMVALCAGIFGQLGDLVESKIKREIGVKDSSNMLLTHGGFLDRFDSLAVVAPLFWIFVYVKFFV